MRERKREREERLVVLVVSARVCCVYVLAISWASYRQGSLSSIDRSAGGGEWGAAAAAAAAADRANHQCNFGAYLYRFDGTVAAD
jgi:hypothetical protein